MLGTNGHLYTTVHPQELRFSHGRGERETSDWWWTARDHGKGTDGRQTPAISCVVFLARPVVSFPYFFVWTFSSKERRLGTRQVHPSRYFLCCFKISPTATSFLPEMSVVRNFNYIYFIIFFKENGLLLCHIPSDVLILCLFNEVGAWLKQLYSVYHLVLKVRKSGKFLLVESAIRNPQHGIQNPRLSVSIHSFTWGDIWHSSSVIVNNSLQVPHVMARFTDLWL